MLEQQISTDCASEDKPAKTSPVPDKNHETLCSPTVVTATPRSPSPTSSPCSSLSSSSPVKVKPNDRIDPPRWVMQDGPKIRDGAVCETYASDEEIGNVRYLWEENKLVIGRYLSKRPMDLQGDGFSKKPMLRRFVHHKSDIRCLQLLDKNGKDGVVVLVEVEGQMYVLKVFKKFQFFGYGRPRTVAQALWRTPLANESRAFARLDSMNFNGAWAVKCHGWMKLSDRQLESIEKVVRLSTCTRWVIVKDYLPLPTDPSHVDKIIENCQFPKMARIIPGDTRRENYRGPLLVDLGDTITEPHPDWRESNFNWFYEMTVNGPKNWKC